MNIQELRNELPEFAKDLKLNLGNLLTTEGAADLSQEQIYGTALACAYATKHPVLIEAISTEVSGSLSEEVMNASKAAAAIMGMNNIYYRFVHLVSDKEFMRLPANLRMSVMANPGVDKLDFELYSLAVSAINGCGMCIDAHVNQLIKAGLSKTGIQSAIRIAATLNGVAQALVISNQ